MRSGADALSDPVRRLGGGPRVAIALLVAVVAGCASGMKDGIVDARPEGVTIQHDSRYASMAGVLADEHCARYGKTAVYAGTRKPGKGTLMMHPNATRTPFTTALT